MIMDHLSDEDERKILVEGCEHCRHTGWVVVGIAAMVSASFHGICYIQVVSVAIFRSYTC